MRRLITMIKNAFKIARLLSVDDSADLRFGSVSMLGKTQKVMIFSPYGLMHNPPSDSLALVWSQQGQESNGIGIADDPKNRTLKDLKSGEVAIGNYLTGAYIYFDENGKCTIAADDMDVLIQNDISLEAINMTTVCSGTFEVQAVNINLIASANIALSAASVAHDGTNIGDDHYHSQGNDSGGSIEQDTGGPQ